MKGIAITLSALATKSAGLGSFVALSMARCVLDALVARLFAVAMRRARGGEHFCVSRRLFVIT